jgi:hypothetical protein
MSSFHEELANKFVTNCKEHDEPLVNLCLAYSLKYCVAGKRDSFVPSTFSYIIRVYTKYL